MLRKQEKISQLETLIASTKQKSVPVHQDEHDTAAANEQMLNAQRVAELECVAVIEGLEAQVKPTYPLPGDTPSAWRHTLRL